MNLNATQAEHCRNSLVKTIYSGLHQWIMKELNRKIYTGCLTTCKYIGILDMPGFGEEI